MLHNIEPSPPGLHWRETWVKTNFKTDTETGTGWPSGNQYIRDFLKINYTSFWFHWGGLSFGCNRDPNDIWFSPTFHYFRELSPINLHVSLKNTIQRYSKKQKYMFICFLYQQVSKRYTISITKRVPCNRRRNVEKWRLDDSCI